MRMLAGVPWWMVIVIAWPVMLVWFLCVLAWDTYRYNHAAGGPLVRDIAKDAAAEADRLDLVAVAEAREQDATVAKLDEIPVPDGPWSIPDEWRSLR